MAFKVAVVGATGNVGREMLGILAERGFPASEIVALASSRSRGTEISFGDKILKCRVLDQHDFSDTDICLMSAGGDISKEWSQRIGAAGCVVIDNSSAYRMHADVPLIVPEVNADAIEGFRKLNIIANPNCSTAQLVVALKPLHDRARIRRVVVATYQSVSGAGKEGMDELFTQTRAVFVSDALENKKFPKRIAFNLIPQIDAFMEDGSTREEWKMMVETKTILREAPGCLLIDRHEPGGYITPHEAAGEDATYISRVREDPTVENGLSLWCVSDNLRKGAALNAVQIAEVLVNRGLSQAKRAAA